MVNSVSSTSSINKSKKVNSSRNSLAKEEDPDAVILTGSEGENLSPIVNPIGKFARLKYGDNLEILFNIDCQVQFLTNYFFNYCKEVNLTRDQIDVADLNAHLKGLKEKSVNSKSALELLQPRETYILVDVKPTDVKNYFIITPLLYNSDLITSHFLNKLQPKPPKQNSKTQPNNPNRNSNPRSSLGNIQQSKSINEVSTSPNYANVNVNSNVVTNTAKKSTSSGSSVNQAKKSLN